MISGYKMVGQAVGNLPLDEVVCTQGTCSPSNAAYQTPSTPVPNVAKHAGCHGHLRVNDTDAYCDYRSLNEFTLRLNFGVDFWRHKLEHIVRKTLDFYCTAEGLDNTLWDIQTDLRNRNLSISPWFSETVASSLKAMRDRFNTIFPANGWAFKNMLWPSGQQIPVPYRVARPAVVDAATIESMYSAIEDVPRWYRSNFWLNVKPPEWNEGAWWDQPVGVGGGILTFFSVLDTGEVVPGPWLTKMLDVFVPGWKAPKASSSSVTVSKVAKSSTRPVARKTAPSALQTSVRDAIARSGSASSGSVSAGSVPIIVAAVVVGAVVVYFATKKK